MNHEEQHEYSCCQSEINRLSWEILEADKAGTDTTELVDELREQQFRLESIERFHGIPD